MKKSIIIVIIFLAIIGFTIFYSINKPSHKSDLGLVQDDCFVTLNNERFDLTLAKTEAERQRGLSGTSSLADNTGKFFVFEKPSMHGFWMKDMGYAIDIVWFDGDMKIVGISQNTTPETYPKVFYPNQNALYTLEIVAGEAEKLNLGFGQSAQLHCQAVLK